MNQTVFKYSNSTDKLPTIQNRETKGKSLEQIAEAFGDKVVFSDDQWDRASGSPRQSKSVAMPAAEELESRASL